jgi:hypothetical protein
LGFEVVEGALDCGPRTSLELKQLVVLFLWGLEDLEVAMLVVYIGVRDDWVGSSGGSEVVFEKNRVLLKLLLAHNLSSANNHINIV